MPLLKPIYQANTIHAGSHIISSDFSLSFEEKATTVVIWNRVVRTVRLQFFDPTHQPTPASQPNLAVQGFPWGMLTTTDEQKRQTDAINTMHVQHLHENFQNCCHMRVIDGIKTIERILHKYSASCGSDYMQHKHQY